VSPSVISKLFLALGKLLLQLNNLSAFTFRTNEGNGDINKIISSLIPLRSLKTLRIDAGGISAKNIKILTSVNTVGMDNLPVI
jgi:hypothetical protein